MWGKENDAEVSDYAAEKQTYAIIIMNEISILPSILNGFLTELSLTELRLYGRFQTIRSIIKILVHGIYFKLYYLLEERLINPCGFWCE